MAPDKFEKYIKEKLNQREITPSDEAWNRIAEHMPVEETRRRKPFVWYSIAASFVGILIIALYVMQSADEVLESPVEVVATEQEEPSTDTETILTEIKTPESQQPQILAASPAEEEEKADMDIDKVKELVPEFSEQANTPAVAMNTELERNIVPEKKEQRETQLIEAKITEVVAEVRLLEMNNDALTEAEVDSLLMKAQHELLKERIFQADRSVDAMALLNEVENELDQSFRDQIFDRLKDGFNKVRTALADRND